LLIPSAVLTSARVANLANLLAVLHSSKVDEDANFRQKSGGSDIWATASGVGPFPFLLCVGNIHHPCTPLYLLSPAMGRCERQAVPGWADLPGRPELICRNNFSVDCFEVGPVKKRTTPVRLGPPGFKPSGAQPVVPVSPIDPKMMPFAFTSVFFGSFCVRRFWILGRETISNWLVRVIQHGISYGPFPFPPLANVADRSLDLCLSGHFVHFGEFNRSLLDELRIETGGATPLPKPLASSAVAAGLVL